MSSFVQLKLETYDPAVWVTLPTLTSTSVQSFSWQKQFYFLPGKHLKLGLSTSFVFDGFETILNQDFLKVFAYSWTT